MFNSVLKGAFGRKGRQKVGSLHSILQRGCKIHSPPSTYSADAWYAYIRWGLAVVAAGTTSIYVPVFLTSLCSATVQTGTGIPTYIKINLCKDVQKGILILKQGVPVISKQVFIVPLSTCSTVSIL